MKPQHELPTILTLGDFDDAIELIEEATTHEGLNEFCALIGTVLRRFRTNQLHVVHELLTMYDSASEHNVDVSRRAVFQLAQRLASVEDVRAAE